MFLIEKKHLVKACYYPSLLLSQILPNWIIEKWVLFDNRLWNIIVSMTMVEVLYKNGRCDFSENLLENLLEDFVEKRKFIPNYKEKYIPAKKSHPTFSVSFSDTLRSFLEVVYPYGIKPFLVFGTLLGYEREGGFISWDLDIDLGIIEDEVDYDLLIKTINNSPFQILECSVNKFPFKLKCSLTGSPVIELIIFKKEGDFFLTYVEIMGQPIQRKRRRFALKKAAMEGVEVFVPEEPNRFLSENYGDWQNPRAIHHYLFDSNLTDYTNPVVRFYAKKYFFELLSNGNQEKVIYYLNLFKIKFPRERIWKSIGDRLVTQLI